MRPPAAGEFRCRRAFPCVVPRCPVSTVSTYYRTPLPPGGERGSCRSSHTQLTPTALFPFTLPSVPRALQDKTRPQHDEHAAGTRSAGGGDRQDDRRAGAIQPPRPVDIIRSAAPFRTLRRRPVRRPTAARAVRRPVSGRARVDRLPRAVQRHLRRSLVSLRPQRHQHAAARAHCLPPGGRSPEQPPRHGRKSRRKRPPAVLATVGVALTEVMAGASDASLFMTMVALLIFTNAATATVSAAAGALPDRPPAAPDSLSGDGGIPGGDRLHPLRPRPVGDERSCSRKCARVPRLFEPGNAVEVGTRRGLRRRAVAAHEVAVGRSARVLATSFALAVVNLSRWAGRQRESLRKRPGRPACCCPVCPTTGCGHRSRSVTWGSPTGGPLWRWCRASCRRSWRRYCACRSTCRASSWMPVPKWTRTASSGWPAVAGLVAAASGSVPGFQSLGYTSICHRLGADSRLTGVVAAATVTLGASFGFGLLGAVPVPLAAAVLLFVGVDLVATWLNRRPQGTGPLRVWHRPADLRYRSFRRVQRGRRRRLARDGSTRRRTALRQGSGRSRVHRARPS